MSGSELTDFVEALRSDPVLKAKAIKVQSDAMANIRRQADAIAAIAQAAGFDLSEWAKRPTDAKSTTPESATECPLTCCAVATSTTS